MRSEYQNSYPSACHEPQLQASNELAARKDGVVGNPVFIPISNSQGNPVGGFFIELEEQSAEIQYGGVKEVLKAINTYSSVKGLEAEVSGLDEKRTDLEAKMRKLDDGYTHLKIVTEICDNLLYKYKFSIPAINDLYKLAKRYGSPLEVLKTLERTGDLKNISMSYEEYWKRLGELKAEAGKLEEELGLARVVSAAIKYPSEAKDLPLDYTCGTVFSAKAFISKISYPPTITSKV